MDYTVEDMENAPEISILSALRNQPFTWRDVFGEIYDNAIDAEATKIRTTGLTQGIGLMFQDNGIGCRDLRAMFRLGTHQELRNTQSGVHGMGFKNVALWLWGHTVVYTRYQGVLQRVRVDWDKVEHWRDLIKVETNPSQGDQYLPDDHGTAVVFYPTSNRRISMITSANLREWLQWTFRPALSRGLVATIEYGKSSFTLKPEAFPRTVQTIEYEGDINGKGFKLFAGIIDQGESVTRSGFHLVRGPRIIESTNAPANGYDASRFFAWVELAKDDWVPGLSKNELTDVDREELFDKLGDICQPILKEAEAWAEMVSNDAVEHEVTEAIEAAHDSAYGVELHIKAKRLPPQDQTGTIEPASGRKKHKRTQRAQPGEKTMATPRPSKMHGKGLWFKLNPLNMTQFYKCDKQEQKLIVTFNSQLELVNYLKQEKNKSALKGMAMSASAVYRATNDDQQPRFGAEAVSDALNEVWMGWQRKFIESLAQ